MSISKLFLKSKPQVKITFVIEENESQEAKSIELVSSHNNWQPIPFTHFKNGKFKLVENIATSELNEFQFVYKAKSKDGNEFTFLPSDADGYINNEFWAQNAILKITK